ncbi:hypothetical protein [Brachybacterium paraconglomeratum]|uniref:hypothetical protein n=1 Tax=Brachybacterium paraconglomeratum TaxID=173362 RepID=UPI0022AF510F|nr:hypothetical protein [Brachybacterium paraconglomeratum]MCZ4325698.1 hypothetical protein [Brachybacterium paraconglomeratum]
MTTDPFTEAARAEAEALFLHSAEVPSPQEIGEHIAVWARDHLAAQEPTDGEVLAALNAQGVVVSPKMHPAPSLDYWGDKPTEAMRAALSAARAARRDEEKR